MHNRYDIAHLHALLIRVSLPGKICWRPKQQPVGADHHLRSLGLPIARHRRNGRLLRKRRLRRFELKIVRPRDSRLVDKSRTMRRGQPRQHRIHRPVRVADAVARPRYNRRIDQTCRRVVAQPVVFHAHPDSRTRLPVQSAKIQRLIRPSIRWPGQRRKIIQCRIGRRRRNSAIGQQRMLHSRQAIKVRISRRCDCRKPAPLLIVGVEKLRRTKSSHRAAQGCAKVFAQIVRLHHPACNHAVAITGRDRESVSGRQRTRTQNKKGRPVEFV